MLEAVEHRAEARARELAAAIYRQCAFAVVEGEGDEEEEAAEERPAAEPPERGDALDPSLGPLLRAERPGAEAAPKAPVERRTPALRGRGRGVSATRGGRAKRPL